MVNGRGGYHGTEGLGDSDPCGVSSQRGELALPVRACGWKIGAERLLGDVTDLFTF